MEAPEERYLELFSGLCLHKHACAIVSACAPKLVSARKGDCVCWGKMILPKLENSKHPAESSPRVKAQYIKDWGECPSWDHPYSNSFLPIIMSYLLDLAQYYLSRQLPSPSPTWASLTALLMDWAPLPIWHSITLTTSPTTCPSPSSCVLVLTLLLCTACVLHTPPANESQQTVRKRLGALKKDGLKYKV